MLFRSRTLNGTDLTGNSLWIEQPAAGDFRKPRVVRGTRIGVDYAGAWAKKPWRFFDGESPYVSTVTAAARRKTLRLQQAEPGNPAKNG